MKLNRDGQITIVVTHKTEQTRNVKNVMGKQYNKAVKRKRRLSYLKRKQAAVKAKRPAKKAAAA